VQQKKEAVTKNIFVYANTASSQHCSLSSTIQKIPNTPDSYIHKAYLQQQGIDTVAIMQNLQQEAPWNQRADPSMMMRGHKLKRTKFFLFAHEDPNLFLKYGYTGFQWATLELYKRWDSMPMLKQALQGMEVNGKAAVFNHIIGTMYVEQRDEIGAHHDKMTDIRPGSDIISLSLGDAREFVLTSEDGVEQQRLVQEDGDLFVLGPVTNAALKHAVLPVKDERIVQRNGAAARPRISIAMRDIKTELSRAQVLAKIAQSERDKERARQAKTCALTKT
jgi:alkylated DNA repair dioxygenase AlkB